MTTRFSFKNAAEKEVLLKRAHSSKPKHKDTVYATDKGWIVDRPNGTKEILVSFAGLASLLEEETAKPLDKHTFIAKEAVIKDEENVVGDVPKRAGRATKGKTMNHLSEFLKLKEDGGASGGSAGGGAAISGGVAATNTVGDGEEAVKLYAPPLTKKIATHGILESATEEEPYIKIPTSPDQTEEIFKFTQIQQKRNLSA